MRRDDLRGIYESLGPVGFLNKLSELVGLQEAIRAKGPGDMKAPTLDPSKVSIRALYEAITGQDADATLGGNRISGNFMELQESVDSTAFPSAVGVLVARKVIDGYNAPGYIGDELVTVMPSRLQSERPVGFTHLEGPKEVKEGMPYEDSGFTEKYVTTLTAKKGRLLSITEETILFDQTGQILMRAAQLGEATRLEREKIIVRGVIDADNASSIYVYRPTGTAEALYSSGNTNYISADTALTDWTDIQEVYAWHAANVKDDRADSKGEPIIWYATQLLTPVAKRGVAYRILNATEVRSGSDTLISGQLPFVSALSSLSSPFVDAVNAYQWYLGDFKRQFIWQEIMPLETLREAQGNEAQFARDILARFKVRYYGGINAVEEKYVIKVNATS